MSRGVFLAELEALPRPALASLRRHPEILPPTLGVQIAESDPYEAYRLVAHLYALHPSPSGQRRSIGSLLTELDERRPGSGFERRFIAMLEAHDLEQLERPLAHALQSVQQEHIPVDYATLLDDLCAWDTPERAVQRRWARDFWSQREAEGDDPELTIPEILQQYELGQSYGWPLRRLAGTGRLPARKLGRSWLIRQSDIERYLATRKRGRPAHATESPAE